MADRSDAWEPEAWTPESPETPVLPDVSPQVNSLAHDDELWFQEQQGNGNSMEARRRYRRMASRHEEPANHRSLSSYPSTSKRSEEVRDVVDLAVDSRGGWLWDVLHVISGLFTRW